MKFSFRNVAVIALTVIFAGAGLMAVADTTSVKAKAGASYVSIALGLYQQIDTTPPSLDIRFEPSGTHVDEKGNLKIRLDFYPGPEDKSYSQQHVYVIDEASPEYTAGYPGETDKDGYPLDEKAYQEWLDKLPHVWKTNPCLCHFLTVKPSITLAELDYLVKSLYPSSVTATIDDASIQANSAHLLSPYMRDKSVTSATKVAPGEDKATLVDSVNARLAGFNIGGQLGEAGEKINPQSIDMGNAATDRSSGLSSNNTFIDLANPANATGNIDTFELWFNTVNATGVVAGTASGSSTSYTTRDSASIGTVTKGSKQTFTGLSVDVNSGDYATVYFAASTTNIEADTSGGSGVYYKGGNQFGAGTQTYTLISSFKMSCYGTGTEAATYDISLDVSSKAFGVVAANTTYYAKGSAPSNPVQDSECTYTITNNGDTCDLDLHGHNFTGGAGWTLTSGAPSSNTVRLTVYYSGQNPASGIVVTTSDQEFYDGLAASSTIKFDFKFETGTFTDGVAKSTTLTLTAVAPD